MIQKLFYIGNIILVYQRKLKIIYNRKYFPKGCVPYIFASLFLGLNECTFQMKKNVFYFTSKPYFVLEKIKFIILHFQISWRHQMLTVGLSHSINFFFICFSDSPSKAMKNAFYFILKALFVFKIFEFLSWLFVHVKKTAWWER